jgi:hypothetical protein
MMNDVNVKNSIIYECQWSSYTTLNTSLIELRISHVITTLDKVKGKKDTFVPVFD